MRGKYVYLQISLEFSGSPNQVDVLPVFLKGAIGQSLKQAFGEIGGLNIPVDVLKFDSSNENNSTTQAILRVPSEDAFKLRTALSLIHQFQGHSCRINIHCVSPVLLSLIRTTVTVQ